MKYYSHFSGEELPASFVLVDLSKHTLGFYDFFFLIYSKLQQLRGTSFSTWHWSEHGKGGKDGQRHDKGTIKLELKTFLWRYSNRLPHLCCPI